MNWLGAYTQQGLVDLMPNDWQAPGKQGKYEFIQTQEVTLEEAADNATSIPEAAMLVAPPIEFLHPQGLPPQHLLVPVRNHHPPEWVRPTGKSPPPSLEATSVNDTASLTTVETAATTGTAMTPGTLDTPETPLPAEE